MGDYAPFVANWTQPNGGIHGYLRRFLESGDATFQHIAIWTLLQLLESEDSKLLELIRKSDDVVEMITKIADTTTDSADEQQEDDENGEAEVIALARRSLQLLGKGEKASLVEG